MSQANRMGLDMTTPSGSNQARWFTNTYLASGSDFDYEQEIKAANKSDSDKVRMISQTELVFHTLHLSCPICTIRRTGTRNWLQCRKNWRTKGLPGTLRRKISSLSRELPRQTYITHSEKKLLQTRFCYPLFKGLFWSDASYKMEQHWQVQLLQPCHLHRYFLNSGNPLDRKGEIFVSVIWGSNGGGRGETLT